MRLPLVGPLQLPPLTQTSNKRISLTVLASFSEKLNFKLCVKAGIYIFFYIVIHFASYWYFLQFFHIFEKFEETKI